VRQCGSDCVCVNALLGAVRNHTPGVVVTDEIGGRDETQAVQLRGSVAVWQWLCDSVCMTVAVCVCVCGSDSDSVCGSACDSDSDSVCGSACGSAQPHPGRCCDRRDWRERRDPGCAVAWQCGSNSLAVAV
jgi:hypothetical protein